MHWMCNAHVWLSYQGHQGFEPAEKGLGMNQYMSCGTLPPCSSLYKGAV